VRTGRARCSALERSLPYSVLANAVRDALRDVPLDRVAAPALAKIMPELGLRAAVRDVPLVTALEALVDLVRRHAPLVLALDDLQWADPSSIVALEYLQRRCADVPVLVVAALRPEEVAPKHSLHRLEPTRRLRVEALTAADLAPLGIPRLYEQTGGIPLFVSAVLAGTTAPDLHATVLEGLRALGPHRHRLLATAATLEQPFEPELLAAILQADVVDVIEELERLAERGLVHVDGLRFGFRFDLMRQALCESLSPARRALLEERLREAEENHVIRETAVGKVAQLADLRQKRPA